MITQNELQYVNNWPIHCPYPGKEYARQSAERLIASFEEFKKYYLNKKYSIILSNGEQLDFEIKDKNLCHLLGVDYKNLTGDYFESFRRDILNVEDSISSYDLLRIIIEKIDEILDYDEIENGKVLNYYRLMIKNAIFQKLSDFSSFNFGVVNFDKNICNRQVGFNSTKLLYVQSNEAICPYFMMGILKDSQYHNKLNDYETIPYVGETLFAPYKPEDYFKEQEVVIPTQIEINDKIHLTKKIATPEEKIALLNQYKLLITRFGLANKLNVLGDYETILASASVKKLIRENV